jgi:tRNA-dihydrouridine synthase A
VRLISKHAVLYTEMVTTAALLHGDRDRLLAFDPSEHPVALQIGGSEPSEMAYCAGLAQQAGYDEVNINVGCPSTRVQSGRFGACLMAEPDIVARCVETMRDAVDLPVTVKTRIGIDVRDSYQALTEFISTVAKAGCHTFIVHARKAWLKGISPKENRRIPPLCYDRVYRLKQDFPQLQFVLNGGIRSIRQAEKQLEHVDGVMVGREAYSNPFMLVDVDRLIYAAQAPVPTRQDLLRRYVAYVDAQVSRGIPLAKITRHLLGLFHGMPGARAWRRVLCENAHKSEAGIEVIEQAARYVDESRNSAHAH